MKALVAILKKGQAKNTLRAVWRNPSSRPCLGNNLSMARVTGNTAGETAVMESSLTDVQGEKRKPGPMLLNLPEKSGAESRAMVVKLGSSILPIAWWDMPRLTAKNDCGFKSRVQVRMAALTAVGPQRQCCDTGSELPINPRPKSRSSMARTLTVRAFVTGATSKRTAVELGGRGS